MQSQHAHCAMQEQTEPPVAQPRDGSYAQHRHRRALGTAGHDGEQLRYRHSWPEMLEMWNHQS